jgi:cytochrome c
MDGGNTGNAGAVFGEPVEGVEPTISQSLPKLPSLHALRLHASTLYQNQSMKYFNTIALAALCFFASINVDKANEQLMEKSGCISCHRIDQKLIGPAYKDVAARYRDHPEVIDTLMQKVREGGEGVWGDVPMAPNSVEKVSDENLRLILQWIMTL